MRRTPSHAWWPGLDGLRCVAVVAVIAYHLGWLHGGGLGVDLFFVLSGFLITSLLLGEGQRHGRIALGEFWGRRARRLLPALFLVLIAIAITGAAWWPAWQLGALRWDGLATLTYWANWRFVASHQGYFSSVAAPSPLRHAWSLGVEEQFYLAWPLVVAAALRWGNGRVRRVVTLAAATAAVASAVAMALEFVAANPSRAYYGTDTHGFALMIGAFAAAAGLHRAVGRWPRAVGGAGFAAGGGAIALLAVGNDRAAWMYHGGFVGFAVLAAVLVLAATAPAGPLVAVLALRPMRWVGRISYGLYLWSWPVQVFTQQRWGLAGWRLAAVTVPVSVTAAALSHRFVEAPIRHGDVLRRLRRGRFVAAPGAAVLVAGILVVATAGAAPLPRYLRTPSARPARLVVHRPRSAPSSTTTVAAGAPRHPQRILWLGDSVAWTLDSALQREVTDRGVAFAAGAFPGCGVVTGLEADSEGTPVGWASGCDAAVPRSQSSAVAAFHPDLVVLSSTWESGPRVVGGQTYWPGTRAWTRELLDLFDQTISRVAGSGAHVAVVLQPDPVSVGAYRVEDRDLADLHDLNATLRLLAHRHRGLVTVVDLAHLVCPTTPCPSQVDGLTLRPTDGRHFNSQAGAAWVAARLAPLLTGINLNGLGHR